MLGHCEKCKKETDVQPYIQAGSNADSTMKTVNLCASCGKDRKKV